MSNDKITFIDHSSEYKKYIQDGKAVIPESVTEIISYAFRGCSSLISIEIPDSVTEIGCEAFSNCVNLISVRIPKSVKKIGAGAFIGCSNLTSIEIPRGVTEIGSYTFKGCSNLLSVEIPDSVAEIGEKAFSRCSALESLEIPDSVIRIGSLAFENCSDLTSIEIPDSVTSIGYFAFDGCSKLVYMVVSPENKHYCSKQNCILSIDGELLIAGCQSSVIPYGVKKIGPRAFRGCHNLESIEIPKSVVEIGDDAFIGCSGLTTLELPDSVAKIGNGAFCYCNGLTTLVLPKGVTWIGEHAFSDCIGLTTLEIPDSVTVIVDEAFYGCIGIRDLQINLKNPDAAEGILKSCGLDFSQISLYVPIGTGYAYRHHDFFRQFKEIIASNTQSLEVFSSDMNEGSHLRDNLKGKQRRVRYVFFDTETNGLPINYEAPSSAINNWPRMVQLSWITVDDKGNVIDENDHIIYPDGFTIPAAVSQVNHITTEIAKESGDPIRTVLAAFMSDVEQAEVIVGHNISFDKHVVGAELIRLGGKDTLASKHSICTMQITVDYCEIPGNYGFKYPKLQELYYKLFNQKFEDAHNALSDTRATLKCFFELKKRGIINDRIII